MIIKFPELRSDDNNRLALTLTDYLPEEAQYDESDIYFDIFIFDDSFSARTELNCFSSQLIQDISTYLHSNKDLRIENYTGASFIQIAADPNKQGYVAIAGTLYHDHFSWGSDPHMTFQLLIPKPQVETMLESVLHKLTELVS